MGKKLHNPILEAFHRVKDSKMSSNSEYIFVLNVFALNCIDEFSFADQDKKTHHQCHHGRRQNNGLADEAKQVPNNSIVFGDTIPSALQSAKGIGGAKAPAVHPPPAGHNYHHGRGVPNAATPVDRATAEPPVKGARSPTFPYSSADWKLFCALPCKAPLVCGHKCSLPCHANDMMGHNQKCIVSMRRDCSRHSSVPVPCHELHGTKPWLCCLSVLCWKDCGHTMTLPCHELAAIVGGRAAVPICTEVIEKDYIHPTCGHHTSNLICNQWLKYNKTPPLCKTVVQIKHNHCDHSVNVPCHGRQFPLPACSVKIHVPRPRCTHVISMSCSAAHALTAKYRERFPLMAKPVQRGPFVKLDERGTYGPAEKSLRYEAFPDCQRIVEIKRNCGHYYQAPCHAAFDMVASKQLPKCVCKVHKSCLFCAGAVSIECHDAYRWDYLQEEVQSLFNSDGLLSEADLFLCTVEASSVAFTELLLLAFVADCKGTCEVMRCCPGQPGHTIKIPCIRLMNNMLSSKTLLPPCDVPVSKTRECGRHSEQVPCSVRLSATESKNSCDSMVAKICSVCHVNSVNAPCHEVRVFCCASLVRTELLCGHIGEWMCSHDGINDLRRHHNTKLGYNSCCRLCAHDQWDIAKQWTVEEAHLRDFASAKLKDVFGGALIKLSEEVFAIHPLLQEAAREQVIKVIQHLLSQPNTMHPTSLPFPSNASSAQAFVDSHYKLVCFVLEEGQQASLHYITTQLMALQPTTYGRGIRQSMEALVLSRQSKVKVCVGVAFTANTLLQTAAFRPQSTEMPASLQPSEMETKLRSTALGTEATGYDSVKVVPDSVHTNECVYWNGNAIIPVSVVEIMEIPHECAVCMTKMPRDGATCSNGHFMCYEEGCFAQYLKGCAATGGNVDREGRLLCFEPKCKAPYDIVRIATSSAPKEITAALIALQTETAVQHRANALEMQFKERLEKEMAQMRALDEEAREVEFLKREIVEKVLTMHCPNPHCAIPFDDFDGCFAITCNKCGAHFCAWCFETDPNDAHGIVQGCIKNPQPGVPFGDRKELLRVWNELRVQGIRHAVAGKTPAIKRKLLDKLKTELRDLGIDDAAVGIM